MGTMLQLPAFPRHGILLNPSPSTSPYGHPASLPGTPHLISSYSSLSSSASSNSPHHYEADHYFLTCASPRDASAIPRNGSLTPTTLHGSGSATSTLASRDAKRASSSFVPQARKIRFAPLPEPRRDELPDVFIDDSTENLNSLPLAPALETPRTASQPGATPPKSTSLLFSSAPAEQQLADSTTAIVVPPPASSSTSTGWSHITNSTSTTTPIAVASSSHSQTSGSCSSDRYDSDTDLATPQSPALHLLSSSSSFISQSCPESPIGRRTDLPCGKEGKDRRWSTRKLFKPLLGLGPLARKDITTEDVLTLGVNQLFRAATRERDDDVSSSGGTTPLRSRSKERSDTGAEVDFGAPLARSSSDQTGMSGLRSKKSKKSSFLASLTGGGSSSAQQDGGLWRTQSAGATTDLRRSKSRESQFAASEGAKRPRSSSTGVGAGATGQPRARKQLKMLNGRVYGAKRNNLNGVNLFASARYVAPLLLSLAFLELNAFSPPFAFVRSEDPEFVEWGYGGMGSVKSAASVGNNIYSRVQGNAAIGSASDTDAGWSSRTRRGSTGAGAPSNNNNNDDDDGSGMAWLKKRREQREREKKEREEKEAQEAGGEQGAQEVEVEVEVEADGKTPLATPAPRETAEQEHITQAVTLPAHPHPHITLTHPHGRPSVERAPSSSFTLRHSVDAQAEVEAEVEAVGEMDGAEAPRERRESESSANSSSTETEDEDLDADAEDNSVRSEDDEEDVAAEEEVRLPSQSWIARGVLTRLSFQERIRRTAVGAGVEKISRHK